MQQPLACSQSAFRASVLRHLLSAQFGRRLLAGVPFILFFRVRFSWAASSNRLAGSPALTKDRILNIHPALLPKYGGQGMYGEHVHAAVLAAGESETGITVHVIDEHYDQGKILAQCRVPIFPEDTPERLAFRVKAREKSFFVEVLQQVTEQGLSQALSCGGFTSESA